MNGEDEEFEDETAENFQAQLLKHKALITDLRGRMEALENIVYQKLQESFKKIPSQNYVAKTKAEDHKIIKLDKILADLDVSLADRLEIVDEDTVKPKVYLGKEDWVTVNKLLKQYGITWLSRGKGSVWSRK